MTAAAFSWFAVVLALVSISEARLGRPRSQYVSGSPEKFYYLQRLSSFAETVNGDLLTGYRVAFELTDSDLRWYTREFQNLLPTHQHQSQPSQKIIIPDFWINKLQVTAQLFPVSSVQHEEDSNELDLNIIIPSIRVNVSSDNCQSMPNGREFSCTTVYVFSSMKVQLRILFLKELRDLSIVSASIVKSEPREINYEVFYKSHRLLYEKLQKGSQAWADCMDKVYFAVPNNSDVQLFLKDLAESIIS